ncbi:MAG: phosphate signaling complex protein PhoU [Acidobacteriota bacterium]|jgi:phosphate transport system protein|nr:phosphate signaling complex protein PhoU [Acidobacteriota bacterium]NLT33423.1 phosphate signaling complex protein PhoU [Acidobacteriota bacterium]
MRQLEGKLQSLQERLLLMGRLAESMLETALRVLIERNGALGAEVMRMEQEVNELQIEIDDTAVKLTALQQPVGGDVRFLFMASRIAMELERIADQAVNIIGNARHLLKAPPLRPLVDLPVMGEIAEGMVKDSLESLVTRECSLANRVFEEEKKVDAYRDQIFRVLLTYMMADPGTIERALALILISRNLERVGDHATNIAEEVIYLVEGREVRHSHESDTRRPEAEA